MASRLRTAAVSALFVLLVPPSSLVAQDVSTMAVPRFEVSSGYLLTRDITREIGKRYPTGWYASGVFNVTPWLGIVGEGSSAYGSTVEHRFGTSYSSYKPRVSTIMAGARFFHKVGRVAPFAQLLAGAAIEQSKSTDIYNDVSHSGSHANNRFALQPGGGVTLYITETVGFRAATDVLFLDEGEGEVQSYGRLLTGFTLQWSGR